MKCEAKSNDCHQKTFIKKCHVCGKVMESYSEIQRCVSCNKPFLPVNYFGKIHAKNSKEFQNLFSTCEDLREDDLIKGLSCIW
jgi:hypothetical protein